MAPLRDLLQEEKVDGLFNIVEAAGDRFLVFTRVANDCWVLCATNGNDVWRMELDKDDLDTQRDLADCDTLKEFIGKVRVAFHGENLSVSQDGVRVKLGVGQGSAALTFDLYEAKAVDRKMELQTILFHMATRAIDLEKELKSSDKKVEMYKQQASNITPAGAVFLDLGDSKKNVAMAKSKPKQAGMSVINPHSKKRKAAKGVTFD